MISEFFIDIIFRLVTGMFSILPDVSLDIDSSVFEVFLDVISIACYLLPMGTVNAIISIIISLSVFRIVIAIVRTIWDLLPLV